MGSCHWLPSSKRLPTGQWETTVACNTHVHYSLGLRRRWWWDAQELNLPRLGEPEPDKNKVWEAYQALRRQARVPKTPQVCSLKKQGKYTERHCLGHSFMCQLQGA